METTTRYCDICAAEVEQAADVLAGLAAAPGLIAGALRSAAADSRDGWTPGEIAAHLGDAEVVFAWRLRQTLAEDEPEIQSFDQDRWAAGMRYERRDPDGSLNLYAAVRASNVELLRMLDDADWERGYKHSEYGRMTIRKLAHHKSDHDLAHLRQIKGE